MRFYTLIIIADNEETLSHFLRSMHFYYDSVITVHYCLGGVLIYRRSGFGDHKPQIWSGPSPCYDKDGVMKFVSLIHGCK